MHNFSVKENSFFYVQDPSNLFYFSGYKSADAKILFTEKENYYFTDARYFEEVSSLPFTIKDIACFYPFLNELNIKTLETDCSVTLDEYDRLKQAGVEKIENSAEKAASLRAVKTPDEVEKIKKSQEITDKTFTCILDEIKEGMTEKELDCVLKSLLYRNGADDLAFDPIVAFGANTSKPHAHPGDTKLAPNSFITLDFGAKYANYCSDMTRTVVFGTPSDEMKEVYSYVLTAQNRALEGLFAGISGKEGHFLAADYFKEKNVEKFFTHSLGHSLGIDIHESPNLSPKYDAPIPENAVTSVEPGLYFPKKFGVRIEDIVLFTKNGVINLTNSEKKLIII